ncbi:MAG TPA: hypothetical protein VIL68_05970 [Propionibacteriaceae bacterium]
MTALPDPMWLIGQPMPDLARQLEVERRGFDTNGRAPTNEPPWKDATASLKETLLSVYLDTPRLCAGRRRALNAEIDAYGKDHGWGAA